MSSATRGWMRSMVFVRTLQTTEVEARASITGSHMRRVRPEFYRASLGLDSRGRPPLARLLGCPLLAGIVAGAGADRQLAISARAGLDMNGAVPGNVFGCGRCVADRILVADIVGDRPADLVDFVEG